MTRAMRGLVSRKLLPLWAVVLGAALFLVLLSPSDVILASEPDADGALVPDSVEALFGTDPEDADSDDDGWDDGE